MPRRVFLSTNQAAATPSATTAAIGKPPSTPMITEEIASPTSPPGPPRIISAIPWQAISEPIVTASDCRPNNVTSQPLMQPTAVAQDLDTDTQLERRPQNKATLQADWTPIDKLHLSATALFVGAWHDI